MIEFHDDDFIALGAGYDSIIFHILPNMPQTQEISGRKIILPEDDAFPTYVLPTVEAAIIHRNIQNKYPIDGRGIQINNLECLLTLAKSWN